MMAIDVDMSNVSQYVSILILFEDTSLDHWCLRQIEDANDAKMYQHTISR